MPKQFEQFDFSKKEDQEKFETLNKNEQKEIAQEAEDEASRMNDAVEEKVTNIKGKSVINLLKENLAKRIEKKETILTPEQKIGKEELIKNFSVYYDPYRRDFSEYIIDTYKLPTKIIKEAIKEALLQILPQGYYRNDYYLHQIENTLKSLKKPIEVEQIIINPEIQQAVKEKLLKILSVDELYNLDVPSIFEFIEKFSLSKDLISSPEIQEKIPRLIGAIIKQDNRSNHNTDVTIDKIEKAKRLFRVRDEIFSDNVIQDEIKESIEEKLFRQYDLKSVLTMKEYFNLSEEDIKIVAEKALGVALSIDNIEVAIKIKNKFHLSGETIEGIIKKEFIRKLGLSSFFIENPKKIKALFNLSEQFIQEAVRDETIKKLSEGDFEDAVALKNQFNLSQNIIDSPVVQEQAAELAVHFLSHRNTGVFSYIRKEFCLPNDFIFINNGAKRIFEDFILEKDNSTETIFNFIKELNIPIAHEIVQKLLIKKITNILSGYNITAVIQKVAEIKDKFSLSSEIIFNPEIQQAASNGFIECLRKGWIDDSFKIKEVFDLSEKITRQASIEWCVAFLRNENAIHLAVKIKDVFNLLDPMVQEIAKNRYVDCLSGNFLSNAIIIKDGFNITISSQEIIQQIPQLDALIKKISQITPSFQMQVEKSSDLAVELCQFIKNPEQLINNLKENPFLVDALANNTRFSSRLLIKYPEFDEASEENIEKLFSSKKKISEQNPEMDPESLEFRQLMQEELKQFKNNPEIMEAIKKQGINLDEWLNYSETSYFNLSTGDNEIAFSEKIRTPIDRIKETIDSYAYTIKSVLKEYRPEMEKFEIVLEDAKPIEEQIAKMETALEQAKTEGNEKKVQGIEKGLASQKEKLNNLKKGFLWDKLTGEIAAFQLLKNDCFDAQNRLMEAENKLESALSGKMPSGKMIQDIKQSITSSKEELRSKFSDLEGRIEEFKTNLPNLITPCLGKREARGLIQEIDQKMAEQFSHFESDRTTVANLFSERGDKETNQLESRPMSIFVWARNPDIDLYQGNYSPCCICIDSAHIGAESTIADYNTDLGIQIVNIWDETKNEPVTAAWCWLGQNENREKALVIDNIESNTLFSSNFSEQLSKELFEYIKDYARKIGADKVVLGKANNDLPTGSNLAKLSEDGSQYEKIGGYNRGGGYFLEAEETGVKLVWDKKQDKITKKQKTEKIKERKLTIKFENISVTGLTEKDLNKIRQLENKIYKNTGLTQGLELIEDLKRGNGLEYSIILKGKNPTKEKEEVIGYIVAVEDETDEGDPSIYMEDVAVLNEAQGQGLGWEMLKELVNKLKTKVQKDGKPVLFDMSLREDGRKLMEKHKNDLENLGVKLIEEALVPDYYNEGEDALYQVYQINVD